MKSEKLRVESVEYRTKNKPITLNAAEQPKEEPMPNSSLFYKTIEAAQKVLSTWIVPDSKITDKEALEELVGILDTEQLVVAMERFQADSE